MVNLLDPLDDGDGEDLFETLPDIKKYSLENLGSRVSLSVETKISELFS